MTSRILIVDDERSMREFVSILMKKQGYEVEIADCAEQAFERIDQENFDLVLTDLKMPGASGLDVLAYQKERDPSTQVILMTAYASHDTAIQAMKAGATDYVTKPFKVEELLVQVEKALEIRALERENFYLKQRLADRTGLNRLVGRSTAMRRVYDMIMRVAPTRTTVLITGESGTGKELVAKAMHENSDRVRNNFVPVNCGAIPENLIESELFGHVKGAFTGAATDKKGLFEMADAGTIFLDEVGELPMSMQVKLLRVLQERAVKQVGAVKEKPLNIRVVAATNRDLKEMVDQGQFREDLYYRLNVIQLMIPSLRERREDLPLLIQHFLQKFADDLGKEMRGVERSAMDLLLSYPYDGNVRELENIIERAVTLEPGDMVTIESLPMHMQSGSNLLQWAGDLEIPEDGLDLDALVENLERNLMTKALR
ncbi:MAG: two-component system response regulator PilR (NtrC family), partial [Bradymonadia bacterium]